MTSQSPTQPSGTAAFGTSPFERFSAIPAQTGLYNPDFERDACGVAMVATLTGKASHAIVQSGITALLNLEHRGASGSEPDSGDGAGILVQIPDEFLRAVVDFSLPPVGAFIASR